MDMSSHWLTPFALTQHSRSRNSARGGFPAAFCAQLLGYSAIGDLTDSVQGHARLLQNKSLKKFDGLRVIQHFWSQVDSQKPRMAKEFTHAISRCRWISLAKFLIQLPVMARTPAAHDKERWRGAVAPHARKQARRVGAAPVL
jgi:hypothetical protein